MRLPSLRHCFPDALLKLLILLNGNGTMSVQKCIYFCCDMRRSFVQECSPIEVPQAKELGAVFRNGGVLGVIYVCEDRVCEIPRGSSEILFPHTLTSTFLGTTLFALGPDSTADE